MIQEITIKREWNTALNMVDTYDFYHTYDYHHLSCNHDTETPILLKYSSGDILIVMPLLQRSISNTEYVDFTSVYGYSGPLSKGVTKDFNNSDFIQALQSYFSNKKVVSIFSRLHPYIGSQDFILHDLGNICSLGRVVNINVSLPLEESRRAYQKSLKNQVNKLRKTCIVRKANNETDILEFVDIYHENMQRLNAKQNYFFDPEYFLNFMKQSDFETDILLVEDQESQNIIAGSMFVKTKGFVQFHLSGTRTDYLRMKPSKLFLDEMRVEATKEAFDYFNLGGGLGSNEDSLFEFKSSFSKDFRTFKVWKYIIDQEAYTTLVSKAQINNTSDYFPLYRVSE